MYIYIYILQLRKTKTQEKNMEMLFSECKFAIQCLENQVT